MAYNKENAEKIKYLKNNKELVYREYIVNKKTTQQLSEEWGLPKSTVYNILKNLSLVGLKSNKTTCNEDKFNIKDPVFCYLAGLVSADGYIDNKHHRVLLRMNEDARCILNKLKIYFDVSSDVAEYSGDGGYTQGYTMYNLTISSTKLIEELGRLNIRGRKKDLLDRFPDMSILTDECQEMYIRGLWDGDGTIRNTGVTSIFEESKKMIYNINNFLINNLGMECHVNPRIVEDKLIGYDLLSTNNSGRYFYKWLYRHNLEFKIEVKYNRQF